MKFLRNNLKVIIGFIIGVILASGISVYAYSYFASDIKYTEEKSVADALNELYSQTNKQLNFGNTQYSNNNSDNISSKSTTLTLSKGKYIINVILSIGSLTDSSLNNSSDITLNLSCANGSPQKIAGRSYVYTSSGYFSGQHTFDICQTTSYYVEITEDNTAVSYSRTDTPNSVISNIIGLQAIPIN